MGYVGALPNEPGADFRAHLNLSLIHIPEPTNLLSIQQADHR